jgi:hypothetical protein
VLPPLALLLAGSILERTREWRALDGSRVRPRANRMIVVACALSGLFLVAVATLIYRAHVVFVDVGDSMTLVCAAVIGAAGIAVIAVSFSRWWRLAPLCLALASSIAFAVLPYGVLAKPRDSAVWHMAQAVKANQRAGAPVGTYHMFVRNLIFYTGIKQADLINDEHVQGFAVQFPGALIALSEPDLERLERVGGLRFERLSTRRYFDEGQFKVSTLIAPDPREDLEVVVLARVYPR